MEILHRDEVKNLVDFKSDTCVSIYIPTHINGRETLEGKDVLKFKNTVHKIEKQLEEKGFKNEKITSFLKPAKTLINDTGFWRFQSEGLAVFIGDNFFTYFKIPLRFEENTIISKKFFLKPLLPLFFENGYFYLLALSKDQVKFFQCTRFSITEIDLEDLVPQGMEEALMYDDPTSNIQHHSGSGGKSNAIFHGQGGGKDVQKTDIARYLNVVDEGIMKLIKGEQTPLVLAAVDYLIPIYKDVSKYNNIMPVSISGNPEYGASKELHQKAVKIVEPWFEQNKSKALKNYYENHDASLVSSSPDRVVPAAFFKQINQLFIRKDGMLWGKFDKENGNLIINNNKNEGQEELLNEVAVQTFINGGEVYELNEDEMPDKNSPVAAVFRFA
jgi:hypothetical protein